MRDPEPWGLSAAAAAPRRISHLQAPRVLEVDKLTVRFGGLVALDSITFGVRAGELCGIIGPNGAGKTTLFNAISRLVPVESGNIRLKDRSLLAVKPSDIAAAGIARTFQHLGVFPTLSVEENIVVGGLARHRIPVVADIFGLPTAAAPRRRLSDRARETAGLCGLEKDYHRVAATLPFGMQKRLELARALATDPSLLLLDEPAGGLSHGEIDDFLQLLTRVKTALKLTIVMIEHHLGLVMRASDHVVVLNFGRKIAEGTAEAVRADPEVIAAYVGTGA